MLHLRQEQTNHLSLITEPKRPYYAQIYEASATYGTYTLASQTVLPTSGPRSPASSPSMINDRGHKPWAALAPPTRSHDSLPACASILSVKGLETTDRLPGLTASSSAASAMANFT